MKKNHRCFKLTYALYLKMLLLIRKLFKMLFTENIAFASFHETENHMSLGNMRMSK